MGLKLPGLDEIELHETIASIRNYARAVAAFSSQFIPYNKIRKGNTLKVSHKGLTTQSIPYYSRDELIYFEMELDFIMQTLWVRAGEEERQIPFYKQSEEEFYFATKNLLSDLGFNLRVELNTFNDEDVKKISPQASEVLLQILHFSSYSLKKFRSEISELTTSVQFRPEQFDQILSVIKNVDLQSKDSDNKHPEMETVDFGFSFGTDEIEKPFFYVTQNSMTGKITRKKLIEPAFWQKKGGVKAVLLYESLIGALDPVESLIQFFLHAYSKIS